MNVTLDFELKRHSTLTANAISGQVAIAAYSSEPVAFWYGMVLASAHSVSDWGDWVVVSSPLEIIGVRPVKFKKNRVQSMSFSRQVHAKLKTHLEFIPYICSLQILEAEYSHCIYPTRFSLD